MKTPPQPKAPRARVKQTLAVKAKRAVLVHDDYGFITTDLPSEYFPDNTTVSIMPRSKEAQEAMIEQGAKTLFDQAWHPKGEPKFVRGLRGYIPTWKEIVTEHPENQIVRNCRDKARAVLASANLVEKPTSPAKTTKRKEGDREQ